ncbi:hypothetical protein PMI18_04890 [Pseudomonas sp. GM102]|uniref:hypothetical protein n=1 Tax=Pseudomonas sp. GM102 TaxID=1144321 RepID=UPI00026F89F3|nr:hypothetical protein [Pseudomonas sp. GM102]EJL96144.1 hypothetical protein PMI18_04890 [Pseudomonas sp. GM102]
MKSERLRRLKFIFGVDSIGGLQVLDLVVSVLNKFGSPPVFLLRGVEVDIKVLEKKILKKKSWPSGLMSNGLELRFGLLPALNQCFLIIEESGSSNKFDWEGMIGPILDVEGFIQAWISDVEYDFWQNATDPLEYECAGRSFADLPQKSNGLPAPLDQMEIDTSGNPGRSVFKQGYVEAIGSTMWLSDLFWERVGRDRLASFLLLETQGVKVFECGRVVKVVASEKCFQDDSTKDKQRILRQILFGVN